MTPVLAALLLLAASSGAPQTAAASNSETKAPSDNASKVIKANDGSLVRCKTYRPSGTRFEKRVCRTVSDWERLREESREAMKEIQTKPQICITGHEWCPGGG